MAALNSDQHTSCTYDANCSPARAAEQLTSGKAGRA